MNLSADISEPLFDSRIPRAAERRISYLGKAPIAPMTEAQLVAAIFGITQECDSDGGECD
ncbi:hypothetical protein [Burkholderia gladioli]|uniref:hypothetical protein n=1 Tax=Burkholderia gladioli TaxID=28095 RepID=UPI003D361D59